jgi:hypothetical protein
VAVRSREELAALLGDRIAAAIPEGSGAEIKNLVDAWCKLIEAQAEGSGTGPGELTVRFVGDARDYSQ